jgi:hypothetical protein
VAAADEGGYRPASGWRLDGPLATGDEQRQHGECGTAISRPGHDLPSGTSTAGTHAADLPDSAAAARSRIRA